MPRLTRVFIDAVGYDVTSFAPASGDLHGFQSELSIKQHERLVLLDDEQTDRQGLIKVRSLETDMEGMVPLECVDRRPEANADEANGQLFYKPQKKTDGANSLEQRKERKKTILILKFAIEIIKLIHEIDAQLGVGTRSSVSPETLLAIFRDRLAAASVKFVVPNEKYRLRGQENAFGLEWKVVGDAPPPNHQVISNSALSAALRDKQQFSLDELESMSGLDVCVLKEKCCVLVDGTYYQPRELRSQPSGKECKKCLAFKMQWFNDAYVNANLAVYDAFISGHPSRIAAAWMERQMVVDAFKTPINILARMSFRTLTSLSRTAIHWAFSDSNFVGEWRARRELLSDGQRAGASLLDASDTKDDITDSNEMVYSGSIHELNELRQAMRKRLSVMNRLPACCNLEALVIMREAWNEIDLCDYMGLWYKRAAKFAFLFMLLLSVATVTVATLFSMHEIQGADGLVSVGSGEMEEANPLSLVSLPLTTAEFESILLALTLSTSFFVSLISFFDPVTKWQKLRSASLLLISDVWKFRTRTGAFAPSSKGGTSNKSKNIEPAKELLRRVIEMREFIAEGAGVKETTFFRGLAKRHFKHGQYELDELETVTGHARKLRERFVQFYADLRSDRVYGWDMLCESPLSVSRRSEYSDEPNETPAKKAKKILRQPSLAVKVCQLNLVRLLAFCLYGAIAVAELLSRLLLILLVQPLRVVRRQVLAWLGRKSGPEAYHHTRQPGAFDETDWHHKPLLPDDYITLRLETTLRFYQSRLSPNASGANFMFILLLVLSISSAVLTQIGFSVWIPIVTSLAGAVTSFQEFSGKNKKLQRYSSAILSLRNVRLWWDALEVSTRNTAQNIEKLVETVEEAIGGESKSWLATSQATKAMAKLAAEPGSDGKAEGEGKQ